MTTPQGPIGREAFRQQLLVQALWRRTADDTLAHWLRDDAAGRLAGLRAYRSNGLALAERALAGCYPTVVELLSAESFAALARAFWMRHPPTDGDIALFGEPLADFVAQDVQLASEPYLADVARLEWAVHRCGFAADAPVLVTGLERLGGEDAPNCSLTLRPGTVLCSSDWPIASIWLAHRRSDADRLDAIAQALTQAQAESALVVRDGWRVVVEVLEHADARFTDAVLRGRPLADALIQAGDAFDFQAWLIRALQQQWLVEVRPAPSENMLGIIE